MINDYNNLIGTMFYSNNKKEATISNIIILNNGYYRLLIKRTEGIYKYIDLTSNEMMILYKEYLVRQERERILTEKGIKRIVHFTKVDNLENILEYGIFSKENLELLGISYLPSDMYRLDGKLNGISTSISYPNYKMFYRKRIDDPNVDWAIITMEPKLIVDKLDTEFYDTNAASGIYSLSDAPTSNDDLLKLFDKENRDLSIPESYTTNPQAEVLVNNCITNNYFLTVETNGNIPKVKSLTRDAHIDYNDSSLLFAPRKDYKRW